MKEEKIYKIKLFKKRKKLYKFFFIKIKFKYIL